MTNSPAGPILIAGAGIAGLTAAIAVARAGFSVRLIERATRFEEIGAGVQLSPNASRVLIGLGLGPAAARRATAPAALVVRRLASARRIGSMPMNAAAERWGSPFWTLLRAELQSALIDAARGEERITFLVGRTVDDVQEAAHGVTVNVRTSSGGLERLEGAALVGADGLWSRVRGVIDAKVKPRFTEYEAWRAVCAAEQAPREARGAEIQLWLARDAHLVNYPVAGGRFVNIVLVRKAASPRDDTTRGGWSARGTQAGLSDALDRFAPPARDLVRAASDWRIWSLFDLPPLARWSHGPVTLIGDAAHAAPPFLAQGAALAIEDAAILAQEAARTPADLSAAFQRYANRRRARSTLVQRASRANARIYHAGGVLAFTRDLVIARLGEAGMLRRYQWLYGWTPDQ